MTFQCVNCTFPLGEPLPARCSHCGIPVSASLPPAATHFPVMDAPTSRPLATVAPPMDSSAQPISPSFQQPPAVPSAMPAPPQWALYTVPVVPPAAPQSGVQRGLMSVLLAFALVCSGIAGAGLYALIQGHQPLAVSAQDRPLPAAVPTSTPAAYHFHDSLQSNTNGWPEVPSNCFFGDGGYHVDNGSACLTPVPPMRDGTVSVDISLVEAVHDDAVAGLWFRRADDQNTYAIVIGRDGQWTIKKGDAGTTSVLVALTPSPALHQGLNVTNTLSVRMSRSHFTFFANGTQIGQVDDDALAEGGFALVALPGAQAIFSNFDVQSPAA